MRKVVGLVVVFVLITIGFVAVMLCIFATDRNCRSMSVMGIATAEGEIFARSWSHSTARYDWSSESWVKATAPERATFFESLLVVSEGPHRGVVVTPDSDGMTVWVGNRPTQVCIH